MAPALTTNACGNDTSNENEAPQQSRQTVVDASKLNDLMENLDKRLAGGLHGEYYETGSKLDDKHRHGQLESVFGLRKELSEIKTQIEKQNQQAEAEQPKATKGAPQGNKNMIATIKTVVQQELSEKLRDLSVRNERLESDLKKATGRMDGLESKNKSLETKLKKAEERNQNLQTKLSDSFVQALETRVKKSEADMAGFLVKLAGVERKVGLLETQVQWLTEGDNVRLAQLQAKVDRHETTLNRISNAVDDLEAAADDEDSSSEDSDDYYSD